MRQRQWQVHIVVWVVVPTLVCALVCTVVPALVCAVVCALVHVAIPAPICIALPLFALLPPWPVVILISLPASPSLCLPSSFSPPHSPPHPRAFVRSFPLLSLSLPVVVFPHSFMPVATHAYFCGWLLD